VIEFGELLCEKILEDVPHRQWVFSLPKRIRLYFLYDRELLPDLSRCTWKVLNTYLKQGVPYEDATPGGVIAVQTYGDFQQVNPHTHVIATDGCFCGDGSFIIGPKPDAKQLEGLFRHEVLKMLKAKGKITDYVIENMMNWHHSGFTVYCGSQILPDDEKGLEQLARYIIHASFSQERMIYIPKRESSDGIAKVVYHSKNKEDSETFDALDFLARIVSHIPDKGEQMARYYGFYSNRSRGERNKKDKDDQSMLVAQTDVSNKAFKKNWARLIKKIYEVDPLVCPKCMGAMRIVAFIEAPDVIKKILKHLGLSLPVQNYS
jgi:hypothetical protein